MCEAAGTGAGVSSSGAGVSGIVLCLCAAAGGHVCRCTSMLGARAVHWQQGHTGSLDAFEKAPAGLPGGMLRLWTLRVQGGCACRLPRKTRGRARPLCQPGSGLAGLVSAVGPPCTLALGALRMSVFPGGAAAWACRRNVGGFIVPFPNEPGQCQWGGGTGGADELLMNWEGEGCSWDCRSVLARALQLTPPLSLFLLEKRQDNGRVYYVNHNTRTTQWEDPRTQG